MLVVAKLLDRVTVKVDNLTIILKDSRILEVVAKFVQEKVVIHIQA